MPELPEVETVRRGLAPVLVGARIELVEQRRADLRFAFPERFVARLTGARVENLARRAKYILAALDTGETLILHLGMSGSFRVERAGEEPLGAVHFTRSKIAAHDHVVFALSNGARVIYNDPRRFGFMQIALTETLDSHPLFRAIGVEPLGPDFTARKLRQLFAGKSAPLKAALLDQSLIAGLGNIYVCEALHSARLSPLRAAGRISQAHARTLATAIRTVLEAAIQAGGSTLRDHRQTDGELGYFQHSFAVYGREGAACPHPLCRGTIARAVQSGRSTFYCATCQK